MGLAPQNPIQNMSASIIMWKRWSSIQNHFYKISKHINSRNATENVYLDWMAFYLVKLPDMTLINQLFIHSLNKFKKWIEKTFVEISLNDFCVGVEYFSVYWNIEPYFKIVFYIIKGHSIKHENIFQKCEFDCRLSIKRKTLNLDVM